MTFDELFTRGLSIEKLRAFLKVVQVGTVMGAAQGNASRRVTMSRQIHELEKALGVPLFVRKGRTLQLTDDGRELALLTASFFAEVEGLVARSSGLGNVLRIGAGASVLETLVLPQLPGFKDQFPKTEFEFVSNSTSELLRFLKEGRVDVAIVRDDAASDDHHTFPCGTMDFVLVGRRDFDSTIPGLSLNQFLARVPLAAIHGRGAFVSTFERMCGDLEVTPTIPYRAETFGQVRDMMLAGCPGGLLPKSMALNLPETDFVLLEDPGLHLLSRNMVLAVEKRTTMVRDRLIETASKLAERLS